MGSRRCWKSREIYSDSAGGVTDGGSPAAPRGGGQRFIGGLGICFTGLSLPEKGCQDSEELPRGRVLVGEPVGDSPAAGMGLCWGERGAFWKGFVDGK